MDKSPKRSFLKSILALPLGVLGLQAAAQAKQDSVRHAPPDLMEKSVERLSRGVLDLDARRQITDVLHRYARGWDRMDEETLRSCFHTDSTHQHGGFEGLSHDFVTAGLKSVQVTRSMTHMITNVLIDIEGDKAVSECYFLAHHRKPSKSGEDMDWFLKGRYLDRFEARNGIWKIAHRTGLSDFSRTFIPADTTFDNSPAGQVSHRKPDDPLYEMLSSLRN